MRCSAQVHIKLHKCRKEEKYEQTEEKRVYQASPWWLQHEVMGPPTENPKFVNYSTVMVCSRSLTVSAVNMLGSASGDASMAEAAAPSDAPAPSSSGAISTPTTATGRQVPQQPRATQWMTFVLLSAPWSGAAACASHPRKEREGVG
jgi:hypothetical protein